MRIGFRLNPGGTGRPLAMGLALALLIALAGCDYWNNLVGTKTQTYTSFSLQVLDAWTREPLPSALCTDSVRNLTALTDPSGLASFAQVSTGKIAFTCQAEGFYAGKLDYDLGQAPVNLPVSLARLGGKDWYPDEPSKSVGITLGQGNLRVPGVQVFMAQPADTNGTFRYKWKSSRYPGLNQDWTKKSAKNPWLEATLTALDSDAILDTITLYVRAKMGNLPEYDVDSTSYVVPWVRNQKPFGKIAGWKPVGVRVGCPADDRPFPLETTSFDPDGGCEIIFSSDDSLSAFGKFRNSYPCSNKLPSYFPLFNRFANIPNLSPNFNLVDSSRLKISVLDDNNESWDTTLTLVVTPHYPPTDTLSILPGHTIHYAGDIVNFRHRATAFQSAVFIQTIDFGDGSDKLSLEIKGEAVDTLDDVRPHTYAQPGYYHVASTITDACGIKTSYSLKDSVHIQANHPPTLIAESRDYLLVANQPTFRLKLTAFDSDWAAGEDSMAVSILWGDGLSTGITINGSNYLTLPLVEHFYAQPPIDTAKNVYHLTIDAQDAHRGSVRPTLDVPPYK